MSNADLIFINTCNKILNDNISSKNENIRAKWSDGTPAHTIKSFGIINRYDLSKEFPIITLRPTNLKNTIEELLWIWQKKSNNINDFNLKIWDSWATNHGTIGKAYGYQMRQKHKYKEGLFDQVDRVIYDLKNNKYSRRIMTNMYNHDDLSEMCLYPCAYSMTFNVTRNKLNGILNQRSQDVLIANNWNVAQYAILIHMFAQVSNLKVGEFIHVISDAHIYDRHIPIVKELIKRKRFDAPKLEINKDIKNFYDFKVDDFKLINYKKNKQIKNIPIAI